MRRERLVPVRRSILVVTEGRNTEFEYLTWLGNELRVGIHLDIRPGNGVTDPDGLLDLASRSVEDRRRRAAKNGVEAPYEETWVLFDTEAHGTGRRIHEACARAKTLGFRVAISRPSFEVWFLLHARPSPGHLQDGNAAVREVQKASGLSDFGKKKDSATKLAKRIAPHTATAIRHAKQSRSQVFSDPDWPQIPSVSGTGVFELVEQLAETGDAAARKRLGF